MTAPSPMSGVITSQSRLAEARRSIAVGSLLWFALAAPPSITGCSKAQGPSRTTPIRGQATSPSPAAPLELIVAPRPVGLRWAEVDDLTFEVALEVEGEEVRVLAKRHALTEHRVLAVGEDGRPTRFAVSQVEWRDLMTIGDMIQASPSPLHGQSYLVSRADGFSVTHADGSAVSSAERDALTKGELIGMSTMLELMASARRWTVGQRQALTPAALRELGEATGGIWSTVTELSFMLRDVDGGKATFEVTMTTQRQSPLPQLVEGAGIMVIDVRTGWLERFELTGRFTGTLLEQQARGTKTIALTYEFTGP